MSSSTLTVDEFLLARIAEDRAAYQGLSAEQPGRWDRLIADCDAKRQIVEMHLPYTDSVYNYTTCGTCGPGIESWEMAEDLHGNADAWWSYPCPTLRLLALVYVDHPDYREVWKP